MALPKPILGCEHGALWPLASDEVSADYPTLPLAARDTCQGTVTNPIITGDEFMTAHMSRESSALVQTLDILVRRYSKVRIKWTLEVERAEPRPQKGNDPTVSRVVEAVSLGGMSQRAGVSQTMVEASSGMAHTSK